ncbi:hypothetical protein P3342_002810 [Pyrenophora teres f. teres]|uniref:BRLZ domain containing protein n=1 Tax=Pyrenophora teres f. teres TaxID=97479 RepID=A0A6S6V908_9PLEO|nr:hypothetical protein PTNB85_01239 [Pyrenophora teres f. teres]KAE8851144.1 hypothetical protein HRS9122_01431 [Pyrenophora teres f. teres]KAE8869817.1 hypothetical protein PTNB29_00161 [Pyrenophora teres f. teres]KAE8873529.1 hypothetical protein PTNB73_00161 [Pyrenophora teres f. teres]KAK1915006.1 hypothetical protein P3342_002810 [Pyrenophora teres f. teres]
MSKKRNDTPSSIRIRENQRRSRNQRKELIHDLQRRVQEYESKGITATQDMQRAARKVAEENLRLRSMLASRGVSQSEIDVYLRSFDVRSERSGPQGHSQGLNNTLLPLQQMGLILGEPGLQPVAHSTARYPIHPLAQTPFQPRTQVHQSDSQYQLGHQRSIRCSSEITQCAKRDVRQESARARSPEYSMPIGPEEIIHSKQAGVEEQSCQRLASNAVFNSTAPFSILDNDTDCPNTATCFCAPTSTPKEQSLDTGLLISCETAATIIAEMRGDGDRNRIRARLGCQGDTECSVKNTLVLELMDER